MQWGYNGICYPDIGTVISRLYLSERAFAGRFEIFYKSMEHRCFAAGTLLLAAVLFLPGLQILFEVTPLSGIEYATILGLAITPTIFIQGYKFITSKKEKNLLK